MSNHENTGYTEGFISKLEVAFGKGFLSPGGKKEVAKIVEGIDLNGKNVLDVGVGIGGPACLLVKEHRAKKVTGIDVEKLVLYKAEATVAANGLGNQIDLQLVSPGPLPFDDASFDVVFSKESIIHMPDKQSLFNEIYRVLKPGGWMAMSDWYCGDEPFTDEMTSWMNTIGLSLVMTSIQHDASLLDGAGFTDTTILDRNDWFTEYSKNLVAQMSGPMYDYIVATLGKEDADDWLSRAKTRSEISAQGQLRPGHLRGRKPG